MQCLQQEKGKNRENIILRAYSTDLGVGGVELKSLGGVGNRKAISFEFNMRLGQLASCPSIPLLPFAFGAKIRAVGSKEKVPKAQRT